MSRRNRARWWWPGCLVTAASGVQAQVYSVRDYGATGNGSTLDSPAIKAAIDVCHSAGGGTVYSPSGMYLTGPLRLKNNVTLNLDADAMIKAAPDALGAYDLPVRRHTESCLCTDAGGMVPGSTSLLFFLPPQQNLWVRSGSGSCPTA